MEVIKNFNLTRMSNDLHVQFHSATVVHVENYGVKALGLEQSTFDEYKAVVEAEQDYVNHTMKSLYTERLAELDAERVELVRHIIARCRYAKSATDATAKAAAGELKRLIVNTYPLKTLKEGGQRKSAFIGGLLVDLEKIDEEALKALGVDTLAAALKKANDGFTKVYWARTSEYEERGLGVMLSLRTQCDELYEDLCTQLNFVANRSDKALEAIADPAEREKASAQRIQAIKFVGEQNRHINFYKVQYLKKGTVDATEDDVFADLEDGSEEAGDGNDNGDTTPGNGADGGAGSKPTGPTDVTEVFE